MNNTGINIYSVDFKPLH